MCQYLLEIINFLSYDSSLLRSLKTSGGLKEVLTEFAGVALVVSHDRWFLDRICTHLIIFEGDSITKMYVGNWSDD